mgnify:CR=1 FL=1
MKSITKVFLVFALASVGCLAGSGVNYKNIQPQEAAKMLETKEVFLLDVHIPEQVHIHGTDVFIPHDELEQYRDKLPKDRDNTILIYCMSGGMSRAAAEQLVGMGYRNVYNLEGGAMAWRQAGYL